MDALRIGFERAPWPIILVVLGSLVGSFLNVVIARLPEGENIAYPGSRCPKCLSPIRAWQNIPIISWVLLRARCANCEASISARYPMIELLTALLFLASWQRFGMTWALGLSLIMVSSLIVITFIDIDLFVIPDEISLPGIIVGMVLRPIAFEVPWWSGIVGAVLGGGFLWFIRWAYFVVRKQEGMGFGDVKLIAMIGAFLGPGALIPCVMVASVVGTVVGVAQIVFLRITEDEEEDEPAEDEPAATPGAVEVNQEEIDATQAASETNKEDTPAATLVAADENDEDDEDDWVPPKGALPFGPFLAIGALSQLLMGPAFERWFFMFQL